MRSSSAAICLVLTTISIAIGQVAERRFDEAERRIVRLPPTAFPELPAKVVQQLQRRGCTIPQTGYGRNPHNVIRGEFAKPGQKDFAVLCSTKGVSTILVFWSGSEKRPSEVAPLEDRFFLQSISAGQIGYSRELNAVGKDFITRHYDAYGGPAPPPIDHQGIDDAFLEKASVVWYFNRSKWLKLTGSD